MAGREVMKGRIMCDKCARPIYHEDSVRSILLGSERVSAILSQSLASLQTTDHISVLTSPQRYCKTDRVAP